MIPELSNDEVCNILIEKCTRSPEMKLWLWDVYVLGKPGSIKNNNTRVTVGELDDGSSVSFYLSHFNFKVKYSFILVNA